MYVWVVDDQIRNLDIQQRYMDKPNANKISQRLQRVKAGVGSIQNIPAILRYLRPFFYMLVFSAEECSMLSAKVID